MWEFLRKANGRCGNCGTKSLKAGAKIGILICQSCGTENKSSWLTSFIGLFILMSTNRFITDNISSPYNWIIIVFGIFPLILFAYSETRLKVISRIDEKE